MSQHITFFNTMFALNHAHSTGRISNKMVDSVLDAIKSNRIEAEKLKPIVMSRCEPEHRDTVWAMILKAEKDGDLSSFHSSNPS